MQDLSRKKFPCKIFQGKHFLARSCKEQISLQDLTSNCIFTRILQDPCKERIFSRPGTPSRLPRATIVPQKNYMTQITCLNLIAIEFLWFSAEFPSFGNKIYKTFEFEPFGPWVFDSETLQKKIIK